MWQGGHEPVLLAETLELLAVRPGGLYVDGTVGLGGHAAAILARSAPDGRLLGLRPRRGGAGARARARSRPSATRVRLVHADFRELPARARGRARRTAILLDLGVSSVQLDTPERGFSFRADGPARHAHGPQRRGTTAADVVNRAARARAGRRHLPLRRGARARGASRARSWPRARAGAHRAPPPSWPRSCAARPAARRRPGPRPRHAHLPGPAHPRQPRARGPGRRRCAALAGRLAPGGRLAVIAFHSLEDREVKQTFRAPGREGFALLTQEAAAARRRRRCARNPRARSARLRGAASGRRHEGRREARAEPWRCSAKAIDNSQVVREVDPRSSRDLWLLLVLVAALVGGLVLYAWPHLQLRQAGTAARAAVARARAPARGEPQAAPGEGDASRTCGAWRRSRARDLGLRAAAARAAGRGGEAGPRPPAARAGGAAPDAGQAEPRR